MPRAIALFLLISLTACQGQAGSPYLPSGAEPAAMNAARARRATVAMTVTIPPRRRHEAPHPNSISPLTQSFTIAVNGGPQAVFNATPGSPHCSTGTAGVSCTFFVVAVAGSDTFTVAAYSGANATGYVLDQANAVIPVSPSTQLVKIRLGPVVSNTSDSGAGSLREAVLDASPGDTIAFIVKLPATIVLTGGAIALKQNVTIAGPGAANLTISGNSKSQIFAVYPNVTAAIDSVTLTGGFTATGNGGAIVNQGNLTIDSDAFTSNSVVGKYIEHAPPPAGTLRENRRAPQHLPHGIYSGGEGGAIADGNPSSSTGSGSLIVTNSTFTGNSAITRSFEGGAIYNAVNFALTVSNSMFTSNSASFGGAIESDGPLALSHDTFGSNTTVTADSGYYFEGAGGAVYALGGTIIDTCSFTSNTATGIHNGAEGFGGAVATGGGTLAITSSTFTGNVAGGSTTPGSGYSEGGAIYSGSTGATIDGSTFKQNSVVNANDVYGAAVYASASMTITNGTFTSNSARSGTGYTYGGIVYAAQPLTIDTSTFTSNTVTAPDYIYGGIVEAQSTSTMKTVTFTKNVISAPGTEAYIYGGVFHAEGTTALQDVQFNQNTTKTPNGSPYIYGGSLYLNANNNALDDLFFTKNSTTATGPDSYIYGGQISGQGSSMFTGLLSADHNTTTQSGSNGYVKGGVFYFSAPATIGTVSITSNTTTASAGNYGYGGAIFANNLSLGVANNGGGIISGNTAPTQGAGIWAGGTSLITETEITGNTVTTPGSAGDGGGGIYNAGTLTITDSTIDNNAVSGAVAGTGGGGINNAINSKLSIANSTIANNTSGVDGGGIENFSTMGQNVLLDDTIYQNTASGNGGNIKNSGATSYEGMANTIVAGGTAGSAGPDISNDGSFFSGDYNIIQSPVSGQALTGNTADNLQVDPKLGALANNGGDTPTNADTTSSPAYDYIPLANCTANGITTDQRGEPRGDNNDNRCDVGAYENQTAPVSLRHAHRHQPLKTRGPRRGI
ncbi:MAG: hypothetical protein JO199_11780 [Candidatus Eremiobacteraeota bacterium]|nr:hypothetical protein [Candidatus Eremiobacteraeota bacterium]